MTRARALYERVGLLAIVGVLTLVVGAAVQHFSSLPAGYTWLEPLRALKSVYEIRYFPTVILATYLVAELRRRAGTVVDIPDDVPASAWRRLAFGASLAFADAGFFRVHAAIDIAAVLVLGTILARQPPRRETALRLLGHAVLGAVVFACICYCYTVIKAITFVNRAQVDAMLAGAEAAVLGAYPHRLIAAYASTDPALVGLCDWVYFRFFHHMMLTTVLLVGMHQAKERTEYLGALAFCYVLGAPLYHVLPAVGPGYFDPEAYAFLAQMPLTTNEIRAWLYQNTNDVLAGRADVVHTWGYVACMPSLHVAQELVMLYYARRSKIALGISSVFSSITIVAVVVLGWHYVIDCFGAILVAGLAIAIARWQRDRLMPRALAPAADATLQRAPFLASLRTAVRLPPAMLAEPPLRAPIVIAGLGLVVRVVIAFSDHTAVDRLFVPDDCYYTLSIARSIAHGLGPTADGVTLTSGFQPLLAFLEVPAFWLTSSLDAPFTWALLIGALADAACIVFLSRIAGRIGGPIAAVLAAAIWALSPLAIANALNGLETSLALACQLALVDRVYLAEEGKRSRDWLIAGACAGLALLARIDSVFLVGALGLFALHRRRFAFAGAAAAVLAPWWGYSLVRFGTVVPESGAAVRMQLVVHRALYLTLERQVAWLGGSLDGVAVVDTPGVRHFVYEHPAAGIALLAFVLAATAFAVQRFFRGQIALAMAVQAVALVLFYGFWLPAFWFMRRYLEPVHGLLCIVVAVAIARGLVARPWARVAASLAVVAAVALAFADTGAFLRAQPSSAGLDAWLNGGKGYATPAKEVLALLPPGSTVGAMQSGALAYFAPSSIHVVNLDGVVDGHARRAIEDNTLLDYAFERHVTHLADWRFNIDAIGRFGKASRHSVKAVPVGRASAQGLDRFAVYSVGWGD